MGRAATPPHEEGNVPRNTKSQLNRTVLALARIRVIVNSSPSEILKLSFRPDQISATLQSLQACLLLIQIEQTWYLQFAKTFQEDKHGSAGIWLDRSTPIKKLRYAPGRHEGMLLNRSETGVQKGILNANVETRRRGSMRTLGRML